MATTTGRDVQAEFFEVLGMLQGLIVSRAIFAAAKLGVPDLLADGPRSVDDLSRATRTHGQSLYRLLRLLTSVGLFEETEGRRFALTNLGERLRGDVTSSARPWAVLAEALGGVRPFDHIVHALKTGESAFGAAYGMNIFDYFERNSDHVDTFDDAMTAGTAALAPQVVANYDFSGFHQLVDIGSGHGTLTAAILKATPGLKATVIDRGYLSRSLENTLSDAGVLNRVDIVSDDFFNGVPQGGDLYLIANVLHNWDDERAAELLRLCQRALAAGGKVLAVDRIIAGEHEGPATRNALISDINMMVYTGGRERTEEEYGHLFGLAGLKLDRTIHAAPPIVMMEGSRSI